VATRDQYRITGLDLEAVKNDLNFALTRIADRLDKLEGIRGKTKFDGESLEVSGPSSMVRVLRCPVLSLLMMTMTNKFTQWNRNGINCTRQNST